MAKALDISEINKILAKDKQRATRTTRVRKDPTEPREYGVWWRLRHRIKEEGCENPNCDDPRTKAGAKTNVIAEVKGKNMCRYCFLSGWLSDTKD